MAKETKNEKKDKVEKEVTKKVAKSTASKKVVTTNKKTSTENTKKGKSATTKKVTSSKSAKSPAKTTPAQKKTTKSASVTKKTTKSTTSEKSTKSKVTKTPRKTSSKAVKSETTAKPMLAEYYDLPYGYNQTIVKILAQTPTTLFVYWDISDEDRKNLIEMHGENFFYETRPVLIVHNITKNYSFEVEINDFANSWYIRCQEPNCDYKMELGRKVIERPEEYIYIDSSNDIISPNDHILFEKSNLGNVVFKNVKTGKLSSKDFGSLRFLHNIDNLYGNIYDVYSILYKSEELNDFANPSSGEFIMKR